MFKKKFLRNLLIPKNNVKTFFKRLIPLQALRSFLKKKIMDISTVKTPKMKKEMRDKLIDYYQDDIYALSKLLNRKLDCWIKK